MKGHHFVKLSTRYVDYHITLNRNITIICGDSGTGKTTMCEELFSFLRDSENVGVKMTSSAGVYVASGISNTDFTEFEKPQYSIMFIDEGARYIRSKDFAKIVEKTGKYFVIITRASLSCLSYSFKEIYELETIQVGNRFQTTNVPAFEVSN